MDDSVEMGRVLCGPERRNAVSATVGDSGAVASGTGSGACCAASTREAARRTSVDCCLQPLPRSYHMLSHLVAWSSDKTTIR